MLDYMHISSIVHTPAPDDARALPTSTGPVSTFPPVWQPAGWNRAAGDACSLDAQQSHSTPALQDALGQKLRKDRKNISVRLSVKTDLTAAEMGQVSKVLLLDNAVSSFSSNSQIISAVWTSLVQRTRSGGVIHFIVTALDEVTAGPWWPRSSPICARAGSVPECHCFRIPYFAAP